MQWHMGVVTFSRNYEKGRDADADADANTDADATAAKVAVAPAQACTAAPERRPSAHHSMSGLGAKCERLAQTAATPPIGLQTDRRAKDDDAVAEQIVNVVRPSGSLELGNDQSEVRVSTDAVRVLFGDAPFLWQQYALLLAEDKMRFERDHPDDFCEVGAVERRRVAEGSGLFTTNSNGHRTTTSFDSRKDLASSKRSVHNNKQ